MKNTLLAVLFAAVAGVANAGPVAVNPPSLAAANAVSTKVLVDVAVKTAAGDVVAGAEKFADCALGYPRVLSYSGYTKQVAVVVEDKTDGDDDNYSLVCKPKAARVDVVSSNVKAAVDRLNGLAATKDRNALNEAGASLDNITSTSLWANDVLDGTIKYVFRPSQSKK